MTQKIGHVPAFPQQNAPFKEMNVGNEPQHVGTRKITVRVSYSALQALDAIRLRNGGRITTAATQLLECAKSIRPENWHAALASLETSGTYHAHEHKTLHPHTPHRSRRPS